MLLHLNTFYLLSIIRQGVKDVIFPPFELNLIRQTIKRGPRRAPQISCVFYKYASSAGRCRARRCAAPYLGEIKQSAPSGTQIVRILSNGKQRRDGHRTQTQPAPYCQGR